MSVEFDDSSGGDNSFGTKPTQDFMVQRAAQPRQSLVTKLILKMHLAKDEHGANRVMVIITVLAFLITFGVLGYQFGIFNKFTSGSQKNTIRFKEDIPEELKGSLPPGYYDSLPSRPK